MMRDAPVVSRGYCGVLHKTTEWSCSHRLLRGSVSHRLCPWLYRSLQIRVRWVLKFHRLGENCAVNQELEQASTVHRPTKSAAALPHEDCGIMHWWILQIHSLPERLKCCLWSSWVFEKKDLMLVQVSRRVYIFQDGCQQGSTKGLQIVSWNVDKHLQLLGNVSKNVV